jgi:hypothetical protein
MQSSAAGSACRVAIHRSSQLHPTLNSAWSGRADRFFVPPPQLRSWHQWNPTLSSAHHSLTDSLSRAV